MQFTKLETDSSEKISYTIIKLFVDMIKDGRLNAGDKLPPERDLTQQLGVSRASLREALSSLSVIGVLESNQGAGSYIGDFNLSTFVNIIAPLLIRNDQMENDLLDFRRLLELDALRLIFEKNSRNTEFLRQQLDIMRSAVYSKNIELSVQADIAFHKHLFTMSENYILKQVYTYVQILMEKSILFNVSRILERGDNAYILYEQHKRLCEYIERGLGDIAVKLLSEHLDFVKKVC